MSSKPSGLRNRHRSGRSTYSRKRKSVVADYYGEWSMGRCKQPEKIAKHLRAVDSEPAEEEGES